MFLDSPNQASRYQGTLLKTVKDRVFQAMHKPEPYFVSALAAYRFEYALRKLANEERDIRPFKYFLLYAFRVRFEPDDFPGAGNKKIADYCKKLGAHLADTTKAKAAFDETVLIVREALGKLSLPVARDSAKSRPLVEEVKKVAIARRETESGAATP